MAKLNSVEKQIGRMKETNDDFSRFLKHQRDKNKKLFNVSLLLTILVVVVFVVYIFFFYATIKNNFKGEKLLLSLEKHAPDILEPVSKQFIRVATEAAPVYHKLAIKKAEETLPVWSAQVEEEMQIFSKETTPQAKEQLRKALVGAIEHQDAPLRAAFPGMTDEDVKTLIAEMEKDLQEGTEEIVNHVFDNSIDDMINLKKTFDSFDTKGLPNNREQLSKLFIHYMLLYLDQEVMEKGGAKIEKGKRWERNVKKGKKRGSGKKGKK
ncbi:MAG: hypothetical protein K8T10_17095 [Candidatus Eremiobacteraeota bacterium]|nr:hypothetical protein [Candidatus Eremiobacteraeota bacterium]